MKTARVKLFVLALFLVAGCGTPEKKAFPVRAPFEVGSYSFVADKYGRYIFEIELETTRSNFFEAAQHLGWCPKPHVELAREKLIKFNWKIVNRTRNALVQQGEGIQVDSRCLPETASKWSNSRTSGIGDQIGIVTKIHSFETKKGDEYSIEISNLENIEGLSKFHPHIVVRIPLGKF